MSRQIPDQAADKPILAVPPAHDDQELVEHHGVSGLVIAVDQRQNKKLPIQELKLEIALDKLDRFIDLFNVNPNPGLSELQLDVIACLTQFFASWDFASSDPRDVVVDKRMTTSRRRHRHHRRRRCLWPLIPAPG